MITRPPSPSPLAMPRSRRAMTLVELVLALTVLTILSTAIFYLLFAAANCDRYTSSEITAFSDIDFAWNRISANAMAALPSTASGMTPAVTTDANGQARLTFIVPDFTNSTTRTLTYYCTGSAGSYTLVEDDPRYNVAAAPNPIAYKLSSFAASVNAATSMKIWITLTLNPTNGIPVQRHICVHCRNF